LPRQCLSGLAIKQWMCIIIILLIFPPLTSVLLFCAPFSQFSQLKQFKGLSESTLFPSMLMNPHANDTHQQSPLLSLI